MPATTRTPTASNARIRRCGNNPVSNLDPTGLDPGNVNPSSDGGDGDGDSGDSGDYGGNVSDWWNKLKNWLGIGHHHESPSKPKQGDAGPVINNTGWGYGLGVFNDWMFGGGDGIRYYGGSSLQSNQMHWSQTGNQIYLAIATNGFKQTQGDVNTFDGFINTARDGFQNGTEAQFGGVGWSFARVGGASYGTVTVYNEVTIDSFFYHVPGILHKLLGGGWNFVALRDPGYITPFGNISQQVQYTIPIPPGY